MPCSVLPLSHAKICGCFCIFVCASSTKCWCEVPTQPLLLHNFQRPLLYLIQWPSLVCSSVDSINLRKAPSEKNMRHYWASASSQKKLRERTSQLDCYWVLDPWALFYTWDFIKLSRLTEGWPSICFHAASKRIVYMFTVLSSALTSCPANSFF